MENRASLYTPGNPTVEKYVNQPAPEWSAQRAKLWIFCILWSRLENPKSSLAFTAFTYTGQEKNLGMDHGTVLDSYAAF